MATRQQMRSAFGPALLRQVDALSPDERAAVLAGISKSTIEHYQSAMPIGWSEMTLHMEVSDAIRAVVGPERNVEVWTGAMTDLADRPLLSGFLRHIGVRFGLNPASLYAQTARLWQHLVRGVGNLEATQTDEGTRVELRDFPVDDHQFICFVEGTHGSLYGIVSPLGVKVSIERGDVDLQAGRAVYDVRW